MLILYTVRAVLVNSLGPRAQRIVNGSELVVSISDDEVVGTDAVDIGTSSGWPTTTSIERYIKFCQLYVSEVRRRMGPVRCGRGMSWSPMEITEHRRSISGLRSLMQSSVETRVSWVVRRMGASLIESSQLAFVLRKKSINIRSHWGTVGRTGLVGRMN